ncbi:TIGR00730 family Rossman fold protein [Moheibacter stercoris]|uniref:Cytokinin riboside 5'-monophosphate phosphoribohydrolase n=1 Tax=Moheibacter stercoris TaxID=1628251 RepID=A0ABV2LWY0_9FLAO
MKSICVYCASSLGNNPIFAEQAYELGKTLSEHGITLVYGGAKVGLMGIVADGSLTNGGNVVGIIPEFLAAKEIKHDQLQELIVVETMHERKALMQEKSDGFIALPGGFGTMEELFEILTWGQLSLHKKPIGILNVGGYYDSLIQLIDTMIQSGLLKEEYKNMVLVSDSIDDLLSQMNLYEVPFTTKWDGSKIM